MSENQTQPATPDMVTMFSAALTEIINKAVDARVNAVLGTVAMAQFMDRTFEERITEIVKNRIDEHTADENHHDIDGAVRDAIDELDLDDKIEHAFRHNVNWEDMVSDLVKEEIEDRLPSDDELHDKVREVLSDVTFTVSVD